MGGKAVGDADRGSGKADGSSGKAVRELGWHNTQVLPDLKPSMRDSTPHSVSVVAVVSERQG